MDFILPEQAETELRDIETAKMIAIKAEKEFPGYMWAVSASAKQGVVRVWSMRLDGNWGFYLHYPSFENDPSLKAVTKACGEILERFRVRLGRANEDQLEGLATVAGKHIFDYHEAKNGKVSESVRLRWDYCK